jgi:hypothetical protein
VDLGGNSEVETTQIVGVSVVDPIAAKEILPNCTCPSGHEHDLYQRIVVEYFHHGRAFRSRACAIDPDEVHSL